MPQQNFSGPDPPEDPAAPPPPPPPPRRIAGTQLGFPRVTEPQANLHREHVNPLSEKADVGCITLAWVHLRVGIIAT